MTKSEIMNLFVAQSTGRTPVAPRELTKLKHACSDIQADDILIVYHLNRRETKETKLVVDTIRTVESKLDNMTFNEFLSEKPHWLVFENT